MQWTGFAASDRQKTCFVDCSWTTFAFFFIPCWMIFSNYDLSQAYPLALKSHRISENGWTCLRIVAFDCSHTVKMNSICLTTSCFDWTRVKTVDLCMFAQSPCCCFGCRSCDCNSHALCVRSSSIHQVSSRGHHCCLKYVYWTSLSYWGIDGICHYACQLWQQDY